MAKATSNTVVETGNALPPAVVKPKSRAVHSKTRLFLYVRAAGRCEFDGCNCYLLEHHVTKQAGNFAEMAHIWAFSENGPRGDLAEAGTDIHDIENLMLLCPTCHKLVDTHRGMFTVEVLRSFKKAHEDRVFELTDTKPDRGTVAVVLRGRVAGKPVVVSLPEIQSAIAPRYCGDRCVHEIDLTAIEDSSSPAFWSIRSRSACAMAIASTPRLECRRARRAQPDLVRCPFTDRSTRRTPRRTARSPSRRPSGPC
ncbi:MAG: HNH endonuclease [Phycisphaerales bacterium]|nr:HNH endonuclease [Phycisphaerales bacterium]